MLVPDVGPVASKTSVRLMVTFTGASAFFASRAARGSQYTASLAPNPPPISIGIAFTLDTGIPTSLAVFSRTVKCP